MDQNLLGSLIGIVKQIPDTAVSEAVSALEQAQEVKDSIPEDYTQLSGDVADLKSAFGEITEANVSTNLYDATSCDPQDGKSYWNGVLNTAANYATTGKIPVEASTQYIFYAGGKQVQYCEYFSGESGGTFISRDTLNNTAFTTPANCTYVAIMLFAASHTEDDYNTAIAAAQLNKGSVILPYEPYGVSHFVPFTSIEGGEKLKGVSDATAVQPGANLYDKTLAVNGKYYYSGTTQSSADYAVSGLIPVVPNTQYNFSKDVATALSISSAYEWDENGTFIGAISSADLHGYVYSYLLSFKTGASTRYVSFNLYKESHTEQEFSDTIDTLMLCYGTQRPHNYSAYNEETVVRESNLSNAFFNNADRFNGKLWLATGTSVTWYDSKAYQAGVHTGEICSGYVGNVSRRKRLNVINEGISGSTLGNVNANSLINRYQNIDWANADIATIEYGINDLGNDVVVGTASDAAGNSTFAACLKTVIEYALAQNPQICLVICTEPDVRGTNTNSNNNTLKDYTDVTLEIAAQYRLPVCDWYYKSGINALNKGDQTHDWMTCDGTHPNDAGHLRMGAMLNQVFDSLIC